VLHEVTGDGGLGFCHPAVPNLLLPGYHGPLVVALDSNALIDIQQHGAAPPTVVVVRLECDEVTMTPIAPIIAVVPPA